MIEISTIDTILNIQLTICRLGEKEHFNWWNTDIAFKLGGSDFLYRLVGSTLAPLSAGEAIIIAARYKEEPLIASIPQKEVFSIFCPESELRYALEQRFRHFKTYPGDVPDNIAEIINPETVWTEVQLLERIAVKTKSEYNGTSFGREITINKSWSSVEKIQALSSTFSITDKGNYVMPYYRKSNAD